MSQKQRADRARKQQVQERNRNLLRAGGAVLALALLAFAGKNLLPDDGAPKAETASSAPASKDGRKIPEALRAHFDREAERERGSDYEKFAANYHPITERQIGPSKVHYARVGDAEVRPKEIEFHAKTYQRFINMADKGLSFSINAYPNEQIERPSSTITAAKAEIVAAPDAEKNLYVVFVDEKYNLGDVHDTGSRTSAVTTDLDDSSETAFTSVRNHDTPTENVYYGLATEACQSAVSFKIKNSKDFNMDKPSGNMADEPGCNLWGPLIAAKELGQSYATYEARRYEQLSGRLFFSSETSTHATEIPIVSQQYYDSFPLAGGIPAPRPEDLQYPLMGPFLTSELH